MKPNRLLSLVAALGLGLLLAAAACQQPAAPPPTESAPVRQPATAPPAATQPPLPQAETDAAVTGTIAYGDGTALPAGAILTVELQDVSRADAASILIAQQVISNPGPPPVAYRLDYRRADIEPQLDYTVSARVETADGKLLFTNDTAYPVLTYGHPRQVDLELVAVQ